MTSLQVVESAAPAVRAGFDLVVDVRSPGEFAEDRVPGAVNLPVLSNAERAEVGTLYVQGSRFKARQVGAAYVARNVAHHLETALAETPGGARLLLYCWRGGMRSNAMALILSQVGWRTSVLAGGYRTYRREVTARLYDAAPAIRVVVLDGPTGSGKTEVLRRLAARGVQVLDLEHLAAHRGSLLGRLQGVDQPSQKMFESRLLALLDGLDANRAVVIEAESSKIGERMVPPVIWQAMAAAPQIELAVAAPARAAYLARNYRDLAGDPAELTALLQRLPSHPGRRRLATWLQLLEQGALEELAAELIELHYDPAYRRSSRKLARARLGQVVLGDLGSDALDRAAAEVARMVEAGQDIID